jgi:hypothetical protein
MKRRMMLFVMMNVILAGCCPSDDGTAEARIRSEIDGCVCAIANGTGGERFSRRVERLVSEMSALSDKEILSSLVTDFATRLDEVELCVRDLGYEGYEDAVCRYNLCTDGVARLKREALGEDEQWLAFFLKSKRRFKKFCFSVSVNETVPNESREERRMRMSCAANLRVAYENEVLMWRSYLRDGGKAILPPSLRAAFVRETQDLFSFQGNGSR